MLKYMLFFLVIDLQSWQGFFKRVICILTVKLECYSVFHELTHWYKPLQSMSLQRFLKFFFLVTNTGKLPQTIYFKAYLPTYLEIFNKSTIIVFILQSTDQISFTYRPNITFKKPKQYVMNS